MATEIIFRILENGKCHYLKEITEKNCLPIFKVENVTKFLSKYNFVKLDETEQRVKIDLPTNRFFKRMWQLENEKNQ